MEKYRMLENIRAHSVVVTKIARLIARGLRDVGMDISIEKTTAGALLHDIGKTLSLKSGGDHSMMGKQICLDNHLYEIADIVGEHVRMKDYDLNGNYSEKEIVFYADKRVNHDKIVSLEERLAYILERYALNKEGVSRAIRMNFELCRKVEERLLGRLNIDPDGLSDLIEHEEIV